MAIKLVLRILGKLGLEIIYEEQFMIADKNYLVDISTAEKELGWKPKCDDKDMLLAAYKNYRSQKND
jgi:dTDP-glucose 4,6-dehydratase